jgi:predicted TIM-barrel fold metal-dependent hydrolase
MKIDVFNHVIPQKYKDALYKVLPESSPSKMIIDSFPALSDMDTRFRVMDKFEDLRQVITLGLPPVEEVADPKKALDLAQIANDEMAELVLKHPDRFVAAAACLPMNNMDAALQEADRAINELNFKGVQIGTPINDKPLDLPEFMPLYEKMSQHDLPIWIHPVRSPGYPDYKTEKMSEYTIFAVFGWPYETTVAMARLVLSGVLEKYPNVKFITHHCSGMIPFLEQRIACSYETYKMRFGGDALGGITKDPIEYFKMFYYDTAINGSTPALMCAHAFCGTDHMLFGTDMPLDSQLGEQFTSQTIESIERMDIDDSDKKKIFEDNIRNLLGLSA